MFAQPPNVQDSGEEKTNGHNNEKLVENPPDLEKWRQRLFDVDETITLSEEE